MNREHQTHIDGLRGIAVLSILLFHLDIPGAEAGFLGVDMFFVVSGYLITGQILRLTADNTFSLARFYLRRARRLLPALCVTLLGTLGAGYLFLSPHDFSLLAYSVLASEFFYSNFYFWATAGYFSDISQSKILLHTWSLSLEEQFYLVWPLLLLLLLRFTKKPERIFTPLIGVAVICLSLSQWAALTVPEAAFYLLPFRFHEFMVGGLAYFLGNSQITKLQAMGCEALAVCGFTLLALSFYLFDAGTTFPGLASLIPSFGVALLLVAAGHSTSGRLLSWMPLRRVGLASYSIYLIHWPLIAFTQKLGATTGNIPTESILFVASIALGYASFRYIEQPFRNPKLPVFHPGTFLPLSVLSFSLLAILATVTVAKDGYPDRFPQSLQMSQEALFSERERYWNAFGKTSHSQLRINDSEHYVLIIGNSHAQDLVYALRQNGFPGNLEIIITPFKCFNFGVGSDPADDDLCQSARDRLLTSPLLSGAERIYLHEDFNGEWVADLLGFLNALRVRSPAPIYLFGPRLTFKKSVLQIAHEHGRLSGLRDYAISQSFLPERENLNNKLLTVFSDQKLTNLDMHFVDTLSVQCGAQRDTCDIVSSKTSGFLYFDNSHFTEQGAAEFGAELRAKHPDLFLLR